MKSGTYLEKPVVALTFDTDHCPELAIEFIEEKLDEYGIPGTFFCTQKYVSIRLPHEEALHPFLKEFGNLDQLFKPLNELKNEIPNAVGNRCHQLTCNGALYRHLGEIDYLYDSAWPMFLHENIKPIRLHSGIIELPIFYAEYLLITEGLKDGFIKKLRAPGLKVFLFHPVHIYHNSNKDTFYEIMQIPYHDRYKQELVSKEEGVLDFFEFLLNTLKSEKFNCYTCREIAESEITKS